MRRNNATGTNRDTLRKIAEYPTPQEILTRIENPKTNWLYKADDSRELMLLRDRALIAVLYTGALRISEARRLTVNQFKLDPFRIVAVKLSKAERRRRNIRNSEGVLIPIPETHPDFNKIYVRKELYRKEVRLPTKGPRGEIAGFIKTYITLLTDYPDFKLFNIGNTRIEQIVKHKVGVTPHWLRAFAENELYELWDNDLIAVAKYVEVDPGTLSKYIHRVPAKYLDRQ
jgi:integrase